MFDFKKPTFFFLKNLSEASPENLSKICQRLSRRFLQRIFQRFSEGFPSISRKFPKDLPKAFRRHSEGIFSIKRRIFCCILLKNLGMSSHFWVGWKKKGAYHPTLGRWEGMPLFHLLTLGCFSCWKKCVLWF